MARTKIVLSSLLSLVALAALAPDARADSTASADLSYRQTVPLERVTPEVALERLQAGNARYVAGETTWTGQTDAQIAAHEQGQAPHAIVLSCADSRVPVELLFDAGLGELFVLRAAGNIATSELIGSAEFAVLALGSPLFVVLGHEHCGAVKGALDVSAAPDSAAAFPDDLGALLTDIGEGLAEPAGVDDAIEQNVRRQMEEIAAVGTFADAIAAGKLRVVGGVYDLTDGQVRFLEDEAGE